MIMKGLLLLTLLCSSFMVTAAKAIAHSPITPPDSTSSLVDRTAATFLIDEGKKLLFAGKS
jgi:hypothetical protein